DSGKIPLHLACAKPPGNPATTEIVKALVRVAGKEAKLAMDKNGETALLLAINSGNIQSVKELLSSGQADQQVKAKRDDGFTPAHLAAKEGDEHMFKVLHAMKAKVDIADHEDRTPLYFATLKGATGIIEFLIDKVKADVQIRSKNGNTLLHLSCANGHVDATVLLLKKGVLPQMPNKEGSLCIHNAARNGHVGVVKALLDKGVPVDIKNKNNLTALHEAVMSRKHGVVQLLIGYGADKELFGGRDCESPIHMAARVRDGEKVADILIRSGANPDTKNKKNGERALHVAARNGNLAVVELLLKEDVEVARRSSNGETPLHQACANGQYEISKLIVDKLFRDKSYAFARLVVNIPNDRGETALHHLCQRVRRKESIEHLINIATLLLENGANMTMTTKAKKETPLHWIARSGNYDVLKAMLTSTKVPLHIIQSGINSKTEIGASPLMIASHHGNLDVVKVLLDHTARVDVFDETGSTALHHAATYGHEEVASILLDHKSFVNGRTKIGITPLHLSSERGYSGLVKILITKYNALVDPATMDKKTPLHMAANSGFADVCSLLLSHRADAICSDAKGMIPVHYAALKDQDEVVGIFQKACPETLTQPNDDGLTVMLLAANAGSIKVIRKLVALNFSNCSTEKAVLSRPLLIAARAGHTAVVEFLLRSGASATEEDKDGMSVMLLGAKFGQMKVVDMLWGKVSIDRPSSKTGLTSVHVASLYGQTDVLQEILSRSAASGSFVSSLTFPSAICSFQHGFTPLHLASQNGDPALIRMLMNSPGVRVDARTVGKERTPLHYAAQEGHIEVVSTLISKTVAPIHMRDSRGQIPLHLAALNGYKELVTLLIGQGSDINTEDQDGNTPIHLAALGGYLAVTMLLTEYGASTTSTTKAGKSAICLAANRRHSDVLNYLLGQKLDHEKLVTDKAFLLDLVNCARKMDQKPLKAFILTAPAPIHISSLLAHVFNTESRKNKEYQTVLSDASICCETISNHLITVSCADDSESVLNALDGQNTAFLDFLITCDQKDCVSHAIVQQYVTEIWYGDLKWQDWKFLLLFLVAFFCPPVWIYMCLPFKNRYHYIPIMKFICRLISHLYLLILFIFTTVIPWELSVNNLLPPPFEWLLLVWVIGLLLSELTSSRERRGLGWIPSIVVVMTFCGVILHLVAIAFESPTRRNLIYTRNQLLAFGMVMCVVQLLEYLSIHRLFGPWGVIIGHLVVDVLRFLVIMFLFVVGFALQLAAVFKPLSEEDRGYSIKDTNMGMASISEMLFFALFGLTSQKDIKSSDPAGYPSGTIPLGKAVFGVYNVLCMIVLINLLIAMMSDTYQRIQTRSDVEWKFGRAKLIRTMEVEVSQPVPINLITFLVNLVRALYKARCNCRRNIIGMMAAEEEQRKAQQKKKHTIRKDNTDRQENGLLAMKLDNSEMAEHANDLRIQNVVDWNKMIDKYFDITGEKSMENSNRGKKALKQSTKSGSGMSAVQATGQALQRLNVINAMKM
ncbi:hypothetical protein QZH41_020795, partial [Actinostola sp. cb2023]